MIKISFLSELKRLEVLSLFNNKLDDFDEVISTLNQLPTMKELDLERNPCTRSYSYKYDLLYYVTCLEKLDGEEVNEYDLELSKTFK